MSPTGTVPEASRRAAARLALDTIGAAIAAHDAAGLPGIRRVIEGWGGRPDATVIGTGARVPAHNAALVNSALARAMELDDVHEQALVHATATTVPVALAVAEQAGGVSGRRFIDAVALGNDIACRLALAVDMRLGGADRRPRVMSLTYQTGVLAGSLVAGRVAGLDSGQLLNCLGVGYSQVAGNLQGLFEGTLTVRLQQGIAAQSAVMALEFARAGITGAHDALEGRAGWYPAFFGGRYGYVRDRLTGGLGETFRGDEISIKPYACCKYGHNAITAAIALHDDPGISPGSIAEVVVRVGQDTWDIICDPVSVKASPEQLAGPDGLALAQFSLPFMVATALLRGRLSAAELDAGWRAGPALASLLPKVTIVVDDADLTPDMIPEPGRVEVVLADGRRRTAEATRTPGHPEHPLDDAALHAKFRSCARRLGSRGTEALLEALTHLDEVEDMRQVARLIGPGVTVHESGHAPSSSAAVPITDLFAVGEDGVSPAVLAPSNGGSRGFGGHVAAVTLAAAYATVPPGLSVHHVHVEFLRPAISGRPLRTSVRLFRDGRTVGRRFVEVAHDGEPPCAIATATFHRRDDRGPEHQPPMPAAPDVAEVPLARTDPVEIRRVAERHRPGTPADVGQAACPAAGR